MIIFWRGPSVCGKQAPSPASIPLCPLQAGVAAGKNKLIKRCNGLPMVFAVPAGSPPNNTSSGTPSGVASSLCCVASLFGRRKKIKNKKRRIRNKQL